MKIGIIGINTLQQEEHFKIIHQALGKNLQGIFSHSEEAIPISTNYNIKLYKSSNELFEKVDAVYFANSVKPNFDYAINALKKACHLFIENISMLSIDEVKQLYKVAFEARTKIQLKLTKSFTPEFSEVRNFISDSKLIEISNSFSKLLRLDDYFSEILNNLFFTNQNIQSGIKKISPLALPLDNNHFSLVQIRLDYDNGAVVNMKFNNISKEDESTVTFHKKDEIIYIDFIKHYAIKHKIAEGQVARQEFLITNETAFNTEMVNFIKSCKDIEMQNISEHPAELKIIQATQEIKDRLIQLFHPM